MAGTTTNFAIPYPSSTDYVTDGATAMRSLADQVDAVMSSGTPARNLLINGAMQIAQRSLSVSSIAGAIAQQYYTADRYATTILGTAGTWTQSVATTADDYPTGSGFRKSLKMLCTTPTTPLAAGGLCFVNQRIEGQNLQAIRKGTSSAQTLTLAFWVKSGVTGTYTASLYDFPNNRQVGKTYTIAVANTWEYKTLLFPADITGAFNNDSSVGLQVAFGLAAGSTYSSGTTQTTWGTYVAANEFAGQVNVAAGNNTAVNYWQMTGAQLTVGSVSVPFEFKSYADNLRDCQRYYEKRNPAFTWNYIGGGINGSYTTSVSFVPKRATGIGYATTGTARNNQAGIFNSAGSVSTYNVVVSLAQQGDYGSNFGLNVAGANVVWGGPTYIEWDSEL